mgnify:CR=1 FL=1
MKPTQTEEGDTPEVPLVAMKTEEETVPLVAIASDKKQEDSDVVPLVHINSLMSPALLCEWTYVVLTFPLQ